MQRRKFAAIAHLIRQRTIRVVKVCESWINVGHIGVEQHPPTRLDCSS